MTKARLGVIGGSGVYELSGAERVAEHRLNTPFGAPSDAIVESRVGDKTAFFLARHGHGHRFLPSEVNYRANIFALKTLGVTHLLAVSAVGIMREDIQRGDLVIPEQIFDRTKGVRPSSFFGHGIVGHVGFADPFCHSLSAHVFKATQAGRYKAHQGGAYVCMEGPQFSTRAESHFYRETLRPAVIGMTALPEAKLAREAEMCYAMLALATDFDCWHGSEEDVSAEAVLQVLKENSAKANATVLEVLRSFDTDTTCACQSAAAYAILTRPDVIPTSVKESLAPLYGKYFR